MDMGQETELQAFKTPQTLMLSRDDLIAIFTEWDRLAAVGNWADNPETPKNPQSMADCLITIAFQI